MLQRVNRFYIILHFIIIVFVCSIVLLTKYHPDHSGLLRTLSAEGGLFEWGSFFISVTIAGFASLIYFHSLRKKIYTKVMRYFILLVAIGAYLIAMEEISWGQRILGFESGDFFSSHNSQKETNLHNLISGEYLNLVIYGLIYILFIFLPLIFYFHPHPDRISPSVKKGIAIYLPSIHNILMFCFASSLQAYFLPRTIADTSFLWLGILVILVLLIRKRAHRNSFLVLHLSLVVIACVVFATSHDVLEYYNMQYEIREFVVSYAFLYWFFNWTTDLKNKISLQRK